MNKKARQLEELVESALNAHRSIRGIGVVDVNGVQIFFKLRKGLKENEEYTRNAIERLDYAIVRYENVIRGIIPIAQELYLLMAFDSELIEFDEIIKKRLTPIVKRYAARL
jgi:hypothetical protein